MAPWLTFLVSLFVAILCIPFSIHQAKQLGRALEIPEPEDGRTVLHDEDISTSYAAQSLEVAYGFPAMILTVVAYEELFGWTSVVSVIALLATLAFTFLLFAFTQPERIGLFLLLRFRFIKWDISVVAASVVAVNLVGLFLAILLPHETETFTF